MGTQETLSNPAPVLQPWLPNTKSASPVHLLDRIDIHIEVPRVDYEKLNENKLGETSETIRKRVQTARDIQNQRFVNSTDIVCNADMRIGEVR